MRVSISRLIPVVGLVIAGAAAPAASAQTTTMPSSSNGWQPGPGAALDNTYQGFIDMPTSGAVISPTGGFEIGGWFVDTTAQGWAVADDVQVFLGSMDSGGKMLAKGVVGESRPDVATALGNPFWASSGFSVDVPGAALPAGSQTVDLYVHTPGKGWWFRQLTVDANPNAPATAPASSSSTSAVASGAPQVTITDPSENESISTKSGDHTIQGTVAAPGASIGDIDRIQVYINGERDSGTLLGETTPQSDGSWSVTFTPTHFPSSFTNIYVYAHSKSTGKETQAIRGFTITDS